MNQRDESMDIAKGIGIFLVVAGHIIKYTTYFSSWIFSFHMPLFFFIAGIFLKGNEEFTVYVKKKTNQLLKPFLLFFIIGMVFTMVVPYYRLSLDDYSNIKLHFYLGKPEFAHVGQIWFLLNLFICEVVFWVWKRIFDNRKTGIKVLSIGVLPIIAYLYTLNAYKFPFKSLPFTLGVVPMSLFFVLMGYISKEAINNMKSTIENILVFIISGCISLGFEYRLNGWVNISETTYNWLGYYLFFAFAGIFFTISVSKLTCRLKLKKLLIWVGRNSLSIMGGHSLFIYIITMILSIKTGEQIYNGSNIPHQLILPVIAIVFIASCFSVKVYNSIMHLSEKKTPL